MLFYEISVAGILRDYRVLRDLVCRNWPDETVVTVRDSGLCWRKRAAAIVNRSSLRTVGCFCRNTAWRVIRVVLTRQAGYIAPALSFFQKLNSSFQQNGFYQCHFIR